MQRIGGFEIVRELGRGGFGVVYEAIDQKLGRRVALKLLNRDAMAHDDIATNVIDEVHKFARVSHPSFANIYSFGQIEDTYYLELEYVEGTPLRTIISMERFTLGRTMSVLINIAEALAYLHNVGIVHCDVKPENIMLTEDSRVMVMDFGIAKLGSSANNITNIDTIHAYSSPERLTHGISPSVDVYALGVLAFEMIAGQLPFAAETLSQLLLKRFNEPPPELINLTPDVPRPLSNLVAQMLDAEPTHRPQTKEVVERLKAIQRHIRDAKLATKILYVPSASSAKFSIEVKTTYIMGGKVTQPALDDEFVYVDE